MIHPRSSVHRRQWLGGKSSSVWNPLAAPRIWSVNIVSCRCPVERKEHDWTPANDVSSSVLPVHNGQAHSPVAPKEVTKVALRLKYLIEQIVPYELDESMITSPNGTILTPQVEQTAREAACENDRACVVFCLMVCQQWFKKEAVYVYPGSPLPLTLPN